MENRALRFILCVGISFALLPAAAWASGGSSLPPPSLPPSSGNNPLEPPPPRKSPAEESVEHYNAGNQHRDKALGLQKEATQAGTEKERGKLENKSRKEFERAISEYRQATQLNPNFYQAFSDLGFALRKTGDYTSALEAYNRALSLAAAYAPAIEYRAEAYLALDQVEDAKKAYLQLFPNDRSHADELLTAMKGWVEKRQTDPGKLTPEMVQSFSTWVQEREELAKQTPSVSELRTRKW
jgi:tetratricopeptide (TPR) repeat protein